MACEEDGKRCFTFIWKLENVSFCWQKDHEYISSPLFTVDEIHETNWQLELWHFSNNNCIGFYSRRCQDSGRENIQIEFELAVLASDGTVLELRRDKKTISKCGIYGFSKFITKDEMFLSKSSTFFPKDTLTVRCRMRKTDVEMSRDVAYFAYTRIDVEKRSFLWNIASFSSLKSYDKKIYEIKSLRNGEQLMRLELFLTGGLISSKTIRFKIIPNFQAMKFSTFKMSIVDVSKKTVECFQDKFGSSECYDNKDFTLFYTKTELMEKKTEYLPNDVLSLWCECAFSFGTIVQEIEKAISDSSAIEKKEKNSCSSDEENKLPLPTSILIDDFKSLLNNSFLSDIKLKTNSQTYPVHKNILSIRSPVFKAMFSSDMKEKVNACVEIVDLNDDAVSGMLRYIYSGEVEELTWARATDIYRAADKYQIRNLREICSSYLKGNLDLINVCEVLVLSDLHQDEDLKSFVQDFILEHGKDIINSEEWGQLMETNLKLAAETMRIKFKE